VFTYPAQSNEKIPAEYLYFAFEAAGDPFIFHLVASFPIKVHAPVAKMETTKTRIDASRDKVSPKSIRGLI
jgi:hypothetical protein